MNTSVFGNNYYPTKTLGEGSFGSVVTVYNDDGEMYAMKVFKSGESDSTNSSKRTTSSDSTTSTNSETVQDLSLDLGTLREISSLSMFSPNMGKKQNLENEEEECKTFYHSPYHPNIITIVDIAYNQQNQLCMIMPKMHIDLENAIKTNLLSVNHKIKIAFSLLSCISFIHKNNLIHRDVKTDNILLDVNLKPYLADFSLAKIFGDNEQTSGVAHTGDVGTQVFKAPEIYHNKKYNKSCDIYSLGVVFIEMFNGLLKINKDKQAQEYVTSLLTKLSDKPLPTLLKKMLEPDIKARITAEEAMKLPLFHNLKKNEIIKVVNKRVNVRIIVPIMSKKEKKKHKVVKDLIHTKWVQLQYSNNLTKDAARYYYEKTNNEVDQLHCLILAGKLYEKDLLSMNKIIECIPSFDITSYVKSEQIILLACNFCLFI